MRKVIKFHDIPEIADESEHNIIARECGALLEISGDFGNGEYHREDFTVQENITGFYLQHSDKK
jgi:hypothetical protein